MTKIVEYEVNTTKFHNGNVCFDASTILRKRDIEMYIVLVILTLVFCLVSCDFFTFGDSCSFSSSIESRASTASSSSDSSLLLGDKGGSAAKETRAQKITSNPRDDAKAICGIV
jgi:hypothetical protein